VIRRTTILEASGGHARRCRHGAFTIVDVVLVVAILAVLGGIAVPRYSLALARYRVAHCRTWRLRYDATVQ